MSYLDRFSTDGREILSIPATCLRSLAKKSKTIFLSRHFCFVLCFSTLNHPLRRRSTSDIFTMISFTLHDAILLATTLLLFYSQVSAYPMNSDSSYSCTPATSYASTVCSFSSTPPSSAASTPDGAIQPAASKESYAEILEMMNFVDQKLEILSNYAHRGEFLSF